MVIHIFIEGVAEALRLPGQAAIIVRHFLNTCDLQVSCSGWQSTLSLPQHPKTQFRKRGLLKRSIPQLGPQLGQKRKRPLLTSLTPDPDLPLRMDQGKLVQRPGQLALALSQSFRDAHNLFQQLPASNGPLALRRHAPHLDARKGQLTPLTLPSPPPTTSPPHRTKNHTSSTGSPTTPSETPTLLSPISTPPHSSPVPA